jgi:hypothetical protein
MNRLLLLLPLLLALPAAAQARGPVPFVGVAVGGSSLPEAFSGCTSDARSAGEIRAGLSFGSLAVEARGGALLAGFDQCLIILSEEVYLPGVHPTVEYPFERGDGHLAAEMRVRYSLPAGLPLVVAAGAGWLAPQDLPYLVASAGVRTRGRVRIALDLDRNWFRVPYDVVVREFSQHGEPGPALSTDRKHDWRGGLGVRLGLELPLR